MTMLSEKEYREVLDLVYMANSCRNIEQFVTGFLPVVSRSFHSEIATFHLLQGDPRELVISESRSFNSGENHFGEDVRNPRLYQDYYYRQSPLLKAALRSSGHSFKIAAVMSPSDWEKQEFFYEFILPQHLYWEMFLALRWNNMLTGMVTLWRPRKEDDFQDADLIKGEILAPHLMLVVHNLCNSHDDLDTTEELASCDYSKMRLKLITEFHLSQRETEILDGVLVGMSYEEMANQFCISKFTVHTHVKNIYMKIGIHNRIDLGRLIQKSAQ